MNQTMMSALAINFDEKMKYIMKYIISPYEPAIGAPTALETRVEAALLTRIRLERQTGLEYRIIMDEGIGGAL